MHDKIRKNASNACVLYDYYCGKPLKLLCFYGGKLHPFFATTLFEAHLAFRLAAILLLPLLSYTKTKIDFYDYLKKELGQDFSQH